MSEPDLIRNEMYRSTFKGAADLIRNPDSWCTHAYALNGEGYHLINTGMDPLIPNEAEHMRKRAKDAKQMCAATAVVVAAPDIDTAAGAIRYFRDQTGWSLQKFNNNFDHAEVVTKLDELAAQ